MTAPPMQRSLMRRRMASSTGLNPGVAIPVAGTRDVGGDAMISSSELLLPMFFVPEESVSAGRSTAHAVAAMPSETKATSESERERMNAFRVSRERTGGRHASMGGSRRSQDLGRTPGAQSARKLLLIRRLPLARIRDSREFESLGTEFREGAHGRVGASPLAPDLRETFAERTMIAALHRMRRFSRVRDVCPTDQSSLGQSIGTSRLIPRILADWRAV